MLCQIFFGGHRSQLQDQVNEWLKTHPVSPQTMHFQFSTVSIEDSDSYRLEHTLVLFYVPMRAM